MMAMVLPVLLVTNTWWVVGSTATPAGPEAPAPTLMGVPTTVGAPRFESSMTEMLPGESPKLVTYARWALSSTATRKGVLPVCRVAIWLLLPVSKTTTWLEFGCATNSKCCVASTSTLPAPPPPILRSVSLLSELPSNTETDLLPRLETYTRWVLGSTAMPTGSLPTLTLLVLLDERLTTEMVLASTLAVYSWGRAGSTPMPSGVEPTL